MANHNSHGGDHHSHHIIPFNIYVKTAGALFVLTILTVVCHQMHLGVLAAPVAFLIAAVKAALVLLFFMGLKYDNMMNRVIFGSGFFFLVLLFFFSALDIWTRIFQDSTL
jgi:cytochrome c oxidase subunit IV